MTTFTKLSSHYIPALQATIEQYLEPVSGARHIHMASDQEELVFMVGFPTVPTVSDGRAHILEHLALCGSQAYPVADPFFAMMRRSVATFMNAMTYADRTVYPFASTDKTDFFNLLDVYLDATFFPKLDYLSFRQEGWRHTFKDGKLAYQGVVFNEMKGTFNNPTRVLSRGINSIVFQGTTYEFDSGGDPLVIPELTHETLLQFHASHYHASQAMFLSAGAIDAAEIQAKLVERVLSKASGSSRRRMPELVATWKETKHADLRVPSQQARTDEYGIQLAWLLGETSDPLSAALAYLLMQGLLGDASAPVMRAMQSAGFGRPSPMNGADTNARQIVFHLGMEGLTEAQIDAAKLCMCDALERAAAVGVPQSALQAALRDLRFSQREIRGGSMPDGLGRLLKAVPILMYGGDVLTAFDNEPRLGALEQQITDPDFFKQMVRDLLDNPSCLISRVLPDAEFFAKRNAIESAELAERELGLRETEREQILVENAALDALQDKRGGTAVLPRILPRDVSPEIRKLPQLQQSSDGRTSVAIASNGISYAHVFYDVSQLPESDWPWLALYAEILPALGFGELSYEQASAWRQERVPSFGLSFEASPRSGTKALNTRISFYASGLREDQAAIADVVHAWTRTVRFDEADRLKFLLSSRIKNTLTTLAQMSDQYAALSATAPLSQKRRFDSIVRGAESLPFCARLQALLASPAGLQEIADILRNLHERVVASPRSVVCAGLEQDGDLLSQLLSAPVKAQEAFAMGSAPEARALPAANAALVVSSQVNHCVIAWSVPDMQDADAAPLAVAAELISNTILHKRLREKGGAYGGTAGYAEEDGVFSMSSYRDPRLAGTYADFSAALDEMLVTHFALDVLDEAIICVIKRLDKPLSPYAQAMRAWNLAQRGITPSQRLQFRRGVLGCTLEQVKAVVLRWLKNGASSRAAAVGNPDQDLAGLQVVDLLALASGVMKVDVA